MEYEEVIIASVGNSIVLIVCFQNDVLCIEEEAALRWACFFEGGSPVVPLYDLRWPVLDLAAPGRTEIRFRKVHALSSRPIRRVGSSHAILSLSDVLIKVLVDFEPGALEQLPIKANHLLSVLASAQAPGSIG